MRYVHFCCFLILPSTGVDDNLLCCVEICLPCARQQRRVLSSAASYESRTNICLHLCRTMW